MNRTTPRTDRTPFPAAPVTAQTPAPRRARSLRTPLAVTALALALAGPLAACSSTSTSTPATTAPTTAAPTTTAGSSSSSGSGGGSSTGSTSAGTGSSGGGAGSASTFSCDGVDAEIPAVYSQPVSDMQSVGSTCTATLSSSGDKVEVTWNRFAADDASFATIAGRLDRAEVPGATKAVGGFDAQGAQVMVLVAGKGAYQLYLTPEFVSNRAATQADVDALASLAAALIARG